MEWLTRYVGRVADHQFNGWVWFLQNEINTTKYIANESGRRVSGFVSDETVAVPERGDRWSSLGVIAQPQTGEGKACALFSLKARVYMRGADVGEGGAFLYARK